MARRAGRHRSFVAATALKALVNEGSVPASTVDEALRKYDIDPNKPNPATS